MTYYALYDLQCGRRMATGLNTTSLKKMKEAMLSYFSGDHDDDELKDLQKCSATELCAAYEFKILKQKKKFKENY